MGYDLGGIIMNLSDMNEQEKKKHFEKYSSDYYKNLKNGICMFDNCKCKSIGAHSISKNYYLKRIADNGEVGTFLSKRNNDKKDLVWERLGINKASVFMGYCKKHDNMFNSIDINGVVTTRDLFLQCYRSICFWYKNTEIASAMLGKIQDDVDDTMRSKIQQTMPAFNYDQFRYDEDYQENKRDDVYALRILKEIFEKIIKNDNVNGIYNRVNNNFFITYGDIEIMYLRVEEKIPVVLNSMNTVSQGNVFHIVLPNDDNTDLIVINATHNKIEFKDAWRARTQNMLNIISLVEAWMILEETWYISPNIIEKLPNERLDIIKNDLRYSQCERQLWQPYDVSIFDDLRKKYIKIYKEQNILGYDREIKEVERFAIPKRSNANQRERNMVDAMIKRQLYMYREEQ